MEKRTVLLITYFFSHKNAIASIRSSKLAKYFIKENWDVTVLTSLQRDTWCRKFDKYEQPIKKQEHEQANIIFSKESYIWSLIFSIYVKFKSKYESANNPIILNGEKKSFIFNIILISRKILSWIFYTVENITLYQSMKKELNVALQNKKYDLIFATYSPTAVLFLGTYAKRMQKEATFIADFRDPMYREVGFFVERKLDYIYERFIFQSANLITCVSNGLRKGILKNHEAITDLKDKIHVITNGYDIEDRLISCIKNNEMHDKKLHFGYMGTLYSNRRDLSIIFHAIAELIREQKIEEKNIVFNYAGNDGNLIKMQANKYNLEKVITDHGFVPRNQSLQIQRLCNVLVVASWNTKSEQGVLPGKVYEYLLANVPIIGVVSGDIPSSELAEIIKKCNVGIAYEEANHITDYSILKNFILSQYVSIQKGISPEFAPIKEHIQGFDYKSIVKSMISLYEKSKIPG